jgi:hypothetical protein
MNANILNAVVLHVNQLRELVQQHPEHAEEIRRLIIREAARPVYAPPPPSATPVAAAPQVVPEVIEIVDDDVVEPTLHPNVTLRRPTHRTGIVELDANLAAHEFRFDGLPPTRAARRAIRREAREARAAVAGLNRRVPRRAAGPKKCVRKTCTKYGEIRLNDASSSECSICMETPLLKDAYTSACGHSYCVVCFDGWEDQCIQKYTRASCPLCRAEAPVLTKYLPRNTNNRVLV